MKIKFNEEKINSSIKLISILLILLVIFLYLNHKFSFFIPCIFHKITGLWCPGCGITRMIISILKLNFYQAFRYNPLLFILTPFFIIYGVTYYINWLQNKEFKLPKIIWNILLVIAIIFMILRNIKAFDFLAPTVI